MPWGAAIAAAGAIGGALISSNSNKAAANSQERSTNAALTEQQRQFDLQRSDSAPYRQVGTDALGELRNGIMTPFSAADLEKDPGYQFRLDQGQTALDRKIAAMGGRVSGAALKATTQYSQGVASGEYNSAYQRSQDRLNRLASLAGLGQTATAASSAAGSNSANAISNLLTNQGDAAGAARLAQGNIWGNAANQLGAVAGRYGSTPNSNYQAPSQFQDGTNFYGGSGQDLYGDGYGPG